MEGQLYNQEASALVGVVTCAAITRQKASPAGGAPRTAVEVDIGARFCRADVSRSSITLTRQELHCIHIKCLDRPSTSVVVRWWLPRSSLS